jgi:membrane-bound inhibitor of C-type lysozyme
MLKWRRRRKAGLLASSQRLAWAVRHGCIPSQPLRRRNDGEGASLASIQPVLASRYWLGAFSCGRADFHWAGTMLRGRTWVGARPLLFSRQHHLLREVQRSRLRHWRTFQNYRCADGTQFIVGFYRYDSRAYLQVDGTAVTLPRRPTLSGSRYSGSGVTLKISKAGTTLKHAKRPTTACEPI